jgi:hypothetical protein
MPRDYQGGPRPIETQYKGYRFRSRLEARWAVFFDAIFAKWEYEKEGFNLGGRRYLPDFWLPYGCATPPSWGFWVEIKPTPLTAEESSVFAELVRTTGNRGFAICGNPWPGEHSVSVFDHHHGRVPEATPLIVGEITESDDHQTPKFLEYFREYGPWPPPKSRRLSIAGENRVFSFHHSDAFSQGDVSLRDAFQVARSARFEHGESPRIP